jgi:hypothetical protein
VGAATVGAAKQQAHPENAHEMRRAAQRAAP